MRQYTLCMYIFMHVYVIYARRGHAMYRTEAHRVDRALFQQHVKIAGRQSFFN